MPPYEGSSDFGVVIAVAQGKRPQRSPYPKLDAQARLWTGLCRCWRSNPISRPVIEDVCVELKHAFQSLNERVIVVRKPTPLISAGASETYPVLSHQRPPGFKRHDITPMYKIASIAPSFFLYAPKDTPTRPRFNMTSFIEFSRYGHIARSFLKHGGTDASLRECL